MSNIDKRALREIAEAAVGAHERLSVMPPDDIFDISLAEGTQLDADLTALNALNSAANPATVLALLDELEPMVLAHLNLNLLCDVYRTAYEEARHDGLVNWEAAASLAEENEELKNKLGAKDKSWAAQDDHINQQADRIESLEKKNGELGRALGAAEKRIAELEALGRGVKQFSEFQICHYGATEDYAKGYIDCQNNYNKVLFAAAGKGE